MKTETYRVLPHATNVLYRGDTYVALIHRGDAQAIADDFNRLIDERDAARREAVSLLKERNDALAKLEPKPRQISDEIVSNLNGAGFQVSVREEDK